MTTYVLVPGFWLGGWAWRPVADALRAQRHEVYAVTLTGLGERVHLARPDIDLETHVTDVTNLLAYEDLTDVVLVGHSYAGSMVTPAVADRCPERIARLVFVDTGPLPDGAAQVDFGSPEDRARDESSLVDGWRLPPLPWAEIAADHDVDADMVRLLTERSVPQPWATTTSTTRLSGAWEALPRLGILCTFTEDDVRQWAAARPLMRHMVGETWRYAHLPTGHWPMLSRPADLTRLLVEE